MWHHGLVRIVEIESQARSPFPLTIKLEFENTPIAIEDLETTKKLLVGSLIFLIRDKTLVCGKISTREEETLRNNSLYIVPITPVHKMKTTIYSLHQVGAFHLFESCVYFEAYQHVLKALNAMTQLPPALEHHLTATDKIVQPPDYVIRHEDLSELSVDISCLLPKQPKINKKALLSSLELYKHLHEEDVGIEKNIVGNETMTMKNLLELSSSNGLRLNESQLKAIKSVFEQRISLVQGPPGTGKSYVGKLIMQLLLSNRHLWGGRQGPQEGQQGPILLVCYTNRALDSFLEDMLNVTNKIIRIGGRSKSDALDIYNLQSVKKGIYESKFH